MKLPAGSVPAVVAPDVAAADAQLAAVRQPLDLRAVALMLVLCLVWGFQPVAVKAVADGTPPVIQLAMRFGVSSIFFLGWVLIREGRTAFKDGTLPSGLMLGTLFSLEFILVGESLRYTTAAHSTVFLYTAPIFTALGLRLHPEERLSRWQWMGIGIAFLGIVIAFLGSSDHSTLQSLLGDGLALTAGASWGFSNVVLRRARVSRAATTKTVLYQVATAAVLLGIYAALTGQIRVEVSTLTVASLLFQTVFVAVASYLLWFWLLSRYLTSRLMLLSLLTPLFAVLFGTLFLGDPIEMRFAVGAVFVLIGVLTVNGQMFRKA